jgi:hypothetical protein
MTTPAEVLETPAFRLTLPGGESHRIVATDGAAARKLLRSKLELSRLPAGVTVEPWEGTGPVLLFACTLTLEEGEDAQIFEVRAVDTDAALVQLREDLGLELLPESVAVVQVDAPLDTSDPQVQGSEDTPASPKPAKKAGKVVAWKSLPDAELAAYLLDHLTLPDKSWVDRRPSGVEREKDEKRSDFIVRVLGDPA